MAARIAGRWSRHRRQEDGTTARTAPAAPIGLPRPRVLRRRQALEGEDEADGRHQVGELCPGRYAHAPSFDAGGAAGLRERNICSIRSVTTNPPTMFDVASTTATATARGSRVRPRAGHQDRADQDDAVDRVGPAHQRRVQDGRHLRDDLEADEHGKHEDRQQGHRLEPRSRAHRGSPRLARVRHARAGPRSRRRSRAPRHRPSSSASAGWRRCGSRAGWHAPAAGRARRAGRRRGCRRARCSTPATVRTRSCRRSPRPGR